MSIYQYKLWNIYLCNKLTKTSCFTFECSNLQNDEFAENSIDVISLKLSSNIDSKNSVNICRKTTWSSDIYCMSKNTKMTDL